MDVYVCLCLLLGRESGLELQTYLLKMLQLGKYLHSVGTSLVILMVENLPAMQKTRVQSLSQEDPLEKGMAPHSSILAWRIPWIEEPGTLLSMGSQKSQTQLSD